MIGRFVIIIAARIGANFVHSRGAFEVIKVVSRMLMGKYKIRKIFFGIPDVIGAIWTLRKNIQSSQRRRKKIFPLIKSIRA